jgi:ubiquinone/menaquinone biosynthesis C-methylase UbiE
VTQRPPHKFDPAHAARLDDPERERYLPRELLISLLELRGSETVLDYGAGTGRLSLAAATLLPTGRVIAVDELPEMLEQLRERTAASANIEPLLISANRVPLADGSVDRILAVNILHEVRGEPALGEMRRLLAPDGLLLVVDWERGRRSDGPPPDEILYSAGEALAELELAGFSASAIDTELPYHFALRASCGA